MLRLEGYQGADAMNAESGLREAEENQPDAIILDLRMPLLDGLGSCAPAVAARSASDARWRSSPATTFSTTRVQRMRELGAELRYKPLWLEDLVGLARNLLKVTALKDAGSGS